jgi:hypothetical protein
LLSRRTGVIHVVIAVITVQGENMIAEESNAPVATESEQPKTNKKAKRAKQGASVAPKKGPSAKKATLAKKAPKARKAAKVREGCKTDQVLALLKRAGGVTAKELMKATGWQPHSVRGFLSGTIGKKMGLTVTSTKGEDGERTYSVKA